MALGTSFDASQVAAQLKAAHQRNAQAPALEAQVAAGALTPAQAVEVAKILDVTVDEKRLTQVYAQRGRTGTSAYGNRQSTADTGVGKHNPLNFRAAEMSKAKAADGAAATSAIIDIGSVTELPDLIAGLKGSVLVVTDLDYTVLVTENAVGRDAWYEDVIKRKYAEGMDHPTAEAFADDLWVKAQMQATATGALKPVEGETAAVMSTLKQDADMVMALTSRDLRLVETTPKQLTHLGAEMKGGGKNGAALHPSHSGALSDVSDFREGILTIKPGENKGTHLAAFLEKFGLTFDHVVMLDDKRKNLTDIQAEMSKAGISFIGCHYEVGKKLDAGLDLVGAARNEAELTGTAVKENTAKRSLLDSPGDVKRERLDARPELATVPHTLNQTASDFKLGTSYEILGSEWYNRWNEPLYGPALNGSIKDILFAPRMDTKEMMRVAHSVSDPRDPKVSYAALTNAQGHVTFVKLDGADHKHAKAFTPVSKDQVPAALQQWHAGHLAAKTGGNVGALKTALKLDGQGLEDLLKDMVTSQIALSGTARRSPDLLKKVTDNLGEMNRHLLLKLKDKKDLAIEDLEFLNAMATRGKSHYGDDIETVRGVARGFSRNVLDEASGQLKRIQNNEHIESTVALNFSPPHIAAQEIQTLLKDINKVKAGTSLDEIARIYQRMILIHPFSDGTGRTSFAVLDYMLLKSGRQPLPHSEESGIPLFKTVPELAQEFARAYAERR